MMQPKKRPFLDFLWGIERETHRLLQDGRLSPLPHPEAFRSPTFTRDFAECMLEIVTAPAASINAVQAELERLTCIAQRTVEPEVLWPFSMPPTLPAPSSIPIAALNRHATLYRQGLALRYGMTRQMICGVHVNVSFGRAMADWLAQNAPLQQGEDSFLLRLARNLYQDLPLLSVLFGASPVAANSETLAVSHRNGPSGYARAGFLPFLDLTSTQSYIAGIQRGLRTASSAFTALGLVRNGRALQLNGNVFQTEKEFYAPIRMRQTAKADETGLQAIARRGVGYLELRFLDVDPFSPIGISEDALRLLHLFILDDLGRATEPRDQKLLEQDLEKAADASRMDPLHPDNGSYLENLRIRLEELRKWASLLDMQESGSSNSRALDAYRRQVADPSLMPPARLAKLFKRSGSDWTTFGLDFADHHKQYKTGMRHALDYARV